MMNLKKIKSVSVALPADFEESVWKTIDVRAAAAREAVTAAEQPGWLDIFQPAPAWTGVIALCLLLAVLAATQMGDNGFDLTGQTLANDYAVSLDQGDSI